MSADFEDAVMERLAVRAQTAMQRVADSAVAKVRADLSEPYPPASKVGEKPHLRTGKLRDGIRAEVIRHGDFVEVQMSSEAEYTVFLEAMGRPVLSDIPDDFAEQIISEIEQQDESFP